MDRFLSGFSHSSQVGQGYTGNINVTGSVSANSSQSVDVTQLKPGDTFQGEIVSINGEDVQIQLVNGQFMAAKLERDVQIALGQFLNLQVQSNKDNRVVLKPIYDNNAQMMRVGEAALRAAQLAVNGKNLTLVSKLIENGMSIDKKNLTAFNRLTLQNPNANIDALLELSKLKLPINEKNIAQLQNYQNMEYKLLDGIKEASNEIWKVYDGLTDVSGNIQTGQAALENGGKFMEQVLLLLAGKERQQPSIANQTVNGQNPQMQVATENVDTPQAALEGKVQEQSVNTDAEFMQKQEANINNNRQAADLKNYDIQNDVQSTLKGEELQKSVHSDFNVILSQLREGKTSELPNRIIAYLNEGKLDVKDMKQLLMDSDFAKLFTTQQKAVIFHSEPFRSMIRNELQKQWTLTPQDLIQQGKVEEFYQKLARESSQLSRIINEAMQESGQSMNASQTRVMGNISENVEFINQMNQMFNYVQLPLKLGNSQAHGDLYVYTNKKNMARNDGMLTAFLHLDMDHLGEIDISIMLQTEKNQVTTKFYLDSDAIMLVEEHITELTERLSRRGYQCKSMVLEKEENKTVLEHIEEQVTGGSAVLSYQTFDTRA